MSVENLFLTVWAWACLTIAIMAVAAAFGRLARKQIAAVFTASLLAMIIGIIFITFGGSRGVVKTFAGIGYAIGFCFWWVDNVIAFFKRHAPHLPAFIKRKSNKKLSTDTKWIIGLTIAILVVAACIAML